MKVGTDAMVLGALVQSNGCRKALDIGTGSGVLSLMIAQKNSSIEIDAIELDFPSAEEARQNFQDSDWSDRLAVHSIDFIQYETEAKYDLIVSNPPYYQTTLENSDERKARARHVGTLTPSLFMRQAVQFLAPEGNIWMIVPYSDRQVWLDAGGKNQLYAELEWEICGKPHASPNRSILVFSLAKKEMEIRNFIIRDENGEYSSEYKTLTKDFHDRKL